MPAVTFADCARCLVRSLCNAHYPAGSWDADKGISPCKVVFPKCECGREFAESDIGVSGDGPDNRTTFVCPECGCITGIDPNEGLSRAELADIARLEQLEEQEEFARAVTAVRGAWR